MQRVANITVRNRPSQTETDTIALRQESWNREREHAHRVFHEIKTRLAEAFAAGDSPRTLKKLVRMFLGNRSVRLSAALRALGGNPSREEVHALRNTLDPWATAYPPVRWYRHPKKSGGYRPICKLPPALKAVHIMLAAIVGAQRPPSAHIFGVPGASRDDAARELKALQNAGYVHLAKTDIVDCFAKINPDALFELPLPQEVTRQALDYRSMTFCEVTNPHLQEAPEDGVRREHPQETFAGSILLPRHHVCDTSPGGPQTIGPKGLMQGSPASSIILAWLLRGLPAGGDAKVLLCFDNIAVAGRKLEDVRAMLDTLADYMRRCPAGPLTLCEPQYFDGTGDPLDWLGYSFDPEAALPGISPHSLDKVEKLLGEAELADLTEKPVLPTVPMHLLRNVFQGFYAAGDGDPHLQRLIESARDAAMWRDNPMADYLLEQVLAPRKTVAGEIVHAVLLANPLPGKNKKRRNGGRR